MIYSSSHKLSCLVSIERSMVNVCQLRWSSASSTPLPNPFNPFSPLHGLSLSPPPWEEVFAASSKHSQASWTHERTTADLADPQNSDRVCTNKAPDDPVIDLTLFSSPSEEEDMTQKDTKRKKKEQHVPTLVLCKTFTPGRQTHWCTLLTH